MFKFWHCWLVLCSKRQDLFSSVVFLLQCRCPVNLTSDKSVSIRLFGQPLARSRDLNFLIFSSNVSFEELVATSHPECLSVNDQLISTFLKFVDLAKFEALFQRFGV